MKRLLILSAFFIFFISNTFSQQSGSCKGYALEQESIIFGKNDYISDGHYYARKLRPGDFAQVYKPFYRGRKYKIVAMAKETLPGVKIQVTNFRRQVMFESKVDTLHIQTWEYTPEKSENLILTVSVPKNPDNSSNIEDCVLILIGFK